ncbi:hypothetical protein GCM10020331_034640 [Ectobacillus funiculus]
MRTPACQMRQSKRRFASWIVTKKLPVSSAESGVIRNYIDWLLSLPWTEATEDILDIERAEGIFG